MIVVDTSAAIAILLRSSHELELATKLFGHAERSMSAVSVVEATMVLSRHHPSPEAVIGTFLAHANITLCQVDQEHVRWAQTAFLTYGKGRHPARLNFGDCFSYAAAKVLNAPLLFLGRDFTQTDIAAA